MFDIDSIAYIERKTAYLQRLAAQRRERLLAEARSRRLPLVIGHDMKRRASKLLRPAARPAGGGT